MGVFQRYTTKDRNGRSKKDGPWFIQYPHSRDPQTGKIRYRTEKASWHKKVAVKMLREKQDAFLKKEKIGIQANDDLTLSELLDWGLEQGVMKAKKSSGDDNPRIKHLITQLGDVRACNVTPLMVDNFKTLMKSTISKKTKKPYSGSTINKMINIPRRIYNLAMDAGIVDTNPFAKRRAFKETPKGKYIPEEDFWSLYKHLPEYIKPIALVGFYTGMRRGEIVDLDWDRVDVSIGLIDLSEDFTKTEEPRKIYFNSIPILRDLFNELAKKRASRSPYVFLREGKPVNREMVSRWFKKASIMAKVGPYRFHDLRHTFNTNMRKAGVDQVTIMKLTGHKTLNMFTRYSHVDEKQANDAMTKLGSLLEGTKG